MHTLTMLRWTGMAVGLLLGMSFSGGQNSAYGDDKETEQRIIAAGDTVELVRFAGSLTRSTELQKDIAERFPKFESEFLLDLPSEFPEVKESTSDLTAGLSLGLVLPEGEGYLGYVIPNVDNDDFEVKTDDNGNQTIDGTVVATTDKYIGMIANDGEDWRLQNSVQLSKNLIDFVTRWESPLVHIEGSPTVIGRSQLKTTFAAYRAVQQTAAQRHDDESDLDYSWRSLTSGHGAKLVELLFRDVETIGLTARTDDPQTPFAFQLEAELRKKSDLLKYFQDMRRRRNKSLSWLHPDSRAFVTFSVALPEKIQQQLITAGQATAEALKNVEGISPHAADQFQQMFQNVSTAGTIDLLLQKVAFSEESECHVLVMPLATAGQLSPELIQLVGNTNETEPISEIDGWPVYSAENIINELGIHPGEDWQSTFIVTESMVALQIFSGDESEKALALLAELTRREFTPSPRGTPLSNAIVAADFSLSDVVDFLGDQAEIPSLLPKDVSTGDPTELAELDKDHADFTLFVDGNRVVARFRFEPNAMALGIWSFETLFETLTGTLFETL